MCDYTIFHGSMETESNKIEDGSVDFVFSDIPFNISAKGAQAVWKDADGNNKSTIHNQKFDESFDEVWDDVDHDTFVKQLHTWSTIWSNKLRKGGTFCIFISDAYLSFLWKAMEDVGLEPKRVITWKKPAAVPFNRKVNPVSGCEFIIFGIKPSGKRTFNSNTTEGSYHEPWCVADKISSIVYKNIRKDYNNKSISDILDDCKKESQKAKDLVRKGPDDIQLVIPNTITFSGGGTKDRVHPTEKPVDLLKYFISLCTNEGDMVLDTFAGSGSTGDAALDLDRKVILIERDATFYSHCVSRLSKYDDLDFS